MTDDRAIAIAQAKKHGARFIKIGNTIWEVYRAEYLPDQGSRAWFAEPIRVVEVPRP